MKYQDGRQMRLDLQLRDAQRQNLRDHPDSESGQTIRALGREGHRTPEELGLRTEKSAVAQMRSLGSRPIDPAHDQGSPLHKAKFAGASLPARVAEYPEFRYMGSKHRLLPWIYSILRTIEFHTAADPFVGTGCVSYLMKAMGKRVFASDFLNFSAIIADATVANQKYRLDNTVIDHLTSEPLHPPDFITRTFQGIFYTVEDLHFLDSDFGQY